MNRNETVPPRSVLMDLDGSTVVPGQGVPNDLASLIRRRSDITWTMVTGRSLQTVTDTGMPQVLAQYRNVVHVFDGGAIISTSCGMIHRQWVLSPAAVHMALRQLAPLAPKIRQLFVSTGSGHGHVVTDYSCRSPAGAERYDTIGRLRDSLPLNVVKMSVQTSAPLVVLKELQEVEASIHVNEQNVDITAPGIDKGTGAAYILEHSRTPPREAIFIFNDHNDIPVIERPELRGLTLVKVGHRLPGLAAHRSVSSPEHVAAVLETLLAPR